MLAAYTEGDEPVPGFRLVRPLGWGRFGEVWQATGPGGIQAALKIVSLGGREALREFRALTLVKHVRHPHLVPVLAFWLKDHGGNFVDVELLGDTLPAQSPTVELVIAMGLGDRTLADRLEECRRGGAPGIPAAELLRYLADAAEALDHLAQPAHDLGAGPVALQHCDVKPQNILLVGRSAQVCDLGVARPVGSQLSSTAVGSAAYMAPEFLRDGRPGPATDQYALAVCYYELRTGRLPLRAKSVAQAYFAHLKGLLDFSLVPDAERAVLVRGAARRPEDRFPSCVALAEALRQAWQPEEDVARLPPDAATWPTIELHVTEAVAEEDSSESLAETAPAPMPIGATLPPATTRFSPTGRTLDRKTTAGVLAASVLLGCLGAGLSRNPTATPENVNPESTATWTVPGPVGIQGRTTSFPDPAAAVAAAQDGDVIVVNIDGLVPTPPLDFRGRALTVRAAPECRPVLVGNSVSPWGALITADRELRLEGLTLQLSEDSEAAASRLIDSAGAPLVLVGCKLMADGSTTPVVCRGCPAVELRECEVVSRGVAVSAESSGDLSLSRCNIRSEEAAVVIWRRPDAGRAPARLMLNHNDISARRGVALVGSFDRAEVDANRNRFAVDEAVVCLAEFKNTPGAEHPLHWHGLANHYRVSSSWLVVGGRPAGVRNLEAWRIWTGSAETGSVEEAAPGGF
jgi:serine/threonine protein kinase